MKFLAIIPFALLVCFCSFSGGNDNPALKKIKNVVFPDYRAFCEFQLQAVETNSNACMWVRVPGSSARKSSFKQAISDYCTTNNCVLKKLVTDSLVLPARIDSVSAHLKTLNTMYSDLTKELATVADYNDPMKMFQEESMFFDEDGPATVMYRQVSRELLDVRKLLDQKMDEMLAEAAK